MKSPLYITRVTSRSSSDIISRARRQGVTVFGETLASSLGTSLRNVRGQNLIYYITTPPIRKDPETPTQLLKGLAL